MELLVIAQIIFGTGTVILAWAYALARKYRPDEETRSLLFFAFIFFVTKFLASLQQ